MAAKLKHFMKLIYFSLDYTPHDHRFLSALAETEHDVYYVRLQRGNRQTEHRPIPAKIHPVKWAGGKKPFEWRNLMQMVWDFGRLLAEIKPDLIHAGPIQTCAFIAVLAERVPFSRMFFRKKIPILCMSWGFDLMHDVDRGAWWRFATWYTLKRSNFFCSDANVTRERAIAFGMNPELTIVFPWGVDLVQYAPEPRVSEIGRNDVFTLFCNRSWELNYGVDVLAHAFVSAAQRRPELRLLLLGGGSQGVYIRKILSDGGVLDKVTFAGHIGQKELPEYYRMADLYISSSHVDGSSVSLMEAMASGLPCLVSDIPANKEWVFEGENGWLFPDGDVTALAEKFMMAMRCVQNDALSLIGRNARKVAETRANWPQNVKKLMTAYEEIIKHA